MLKMQFRHVHSSQRLLHKWTDNCDTFLLAAYEKFGPAWSLIAQETKRKPEECRKRWLSLSGTLEKERYEADRQLWLDGYERVTRTDGQVGWIRVPIDELPETPLNRLTEHLQPPLHRSNWQKKEAGWSEAEALILREGYEQEIVPLLKNSEGVEAAEIMVAWKSISRKLSRRTPGQCKAFFDRQHVLWRAQEKIETLLLLSKAE
jgi:hypothetical protein